MKSETDRRLATLLTRVRTERSQVEEDLRAKQFENRARHDEVVCLLRRVEGIVGEFADRLRLVGHTATLTLSLGCVSTDPGQDAEPQDRIAAVCDWNGPTLEFAVGLADGSRRAALVVRGLRDCMAIESTTLSRPTREPAIEVADGDLGDDLVESIAIEFLERWAALIPRDA
ncbi:MAG: hypothetical protein ACRERC_13155 [Candidatus Binatia bacterium]